MRLLHILRLAIRYRLDTFIQDLPLPLPIRVALGVLHLGKEPKASRGERLRRFFEELGPVFVKFGQLLSTRPDLIPPDIIEELDHLQDNVPPFSGDAFTAIVETALDDSVDNVFAQFDRTPLASASVAQVHTATLKNGQEVVVKVIRPGIEHTITKDMALMRLIARVIERYTPDGERLRPQEVVEDYSHTIFDELDLQREAANASQLRRNFHHSPMLYVPEVYWEYCRSDVMVMERIHGIPVTNINALKQQKTNMALLAERGVEIFFTQVFEHNFFHADMHPGNIFVSENTPHSPQYIAVDMAIVGSLSREDQYYLARNLLAMFRRDYRLVAELHVQSGWVPADTPVGQFEGAIRAVCEPIFEKPLAEISFGHVLIKLFQTARRFNMEVQPQLVLLQKTLLNIEGLGRQLYPQLDLWKTAHPYLEAWLKKRFHPKTLVKELRRYGPEWLEKLPEVPHSLFNGLEKLDLLAETTEEVRLAAKNFADDSSRRRRSRRTILSMVAFGAATALAIPPAAQYLADMPTGTWLLLALAGAIWLSR
nr:ubiquinone biosynthesis regulatory protein kinase UbiB [Marinibactrum halimedae]